MNTTITVLTATLNSPDKGQLNSESKRTGEPPRLGGEWNHCEFVSCLFVLDLAAIRCAELGRNCKC